MQALLAELVVQAGREQANPAMLQVQRLQLELAQIDREIQAARLSMSRPSSSEATHPAAAPGEVAVAVEREADDEAASGVWEPRAGGISGLAARKADVMREFDRAYAMVLDETGDRGD